MKKSFLILSGIIAIAVTAALFGTKSYELKYSSRVELENVDQLAKGAAEHYNLLRADPLTGVIDQEMVLKVRNAMDKLPKSLKTEDYQWDTRGPDNIGGRTRGFHVYKNDPNKMLAGSVTGGLFKSTNGGASWQRLEGFNDGIGVTSIARLGNGTIYVGTGSSFEGQSASTSSSGVIGHGLFKSTDEGVTFTNVYEPGSQDFSNGEWAEVDEVLADPVNDNMVWVAYGGGLAKLNDSNGDLNNIINQQVEDFDISDDGQGIICVRGGNIRISMDGGDNFTSVGTNENDGGIPSSSGRKVVAISPDDKNVMYVTTTSGGSLKGVFASINGGTTFDRIANDSNNGSNPFFSPFGENRQGGYDNALTVMPGSPGTIILGGIACYRWDMSEGSTTNEINGSWNQINNLFSFPDDSYIHSDIHNFKWDANGIFFALTDGGIFRSFDTSVSSFYPINHNYVTTQFYGIAYNGQNAIFGGTQDNGTIVVTPQGVNSLNESFPVMGGDGFDTEASQERNVMFASIYYNAIQRISYTNSGSGSATQVVLKDGTFGEGSAPFYTGMRYYENFNETMAPDDHLLIAPVAIHEDSVIHYTSTSFQVPLTAIADQDYTEGDSIYLPDPVRTLFVYNTFGKIYITRDVVVSTLSSGDWAEFNVQGRATCYEFSPDGDHLYIGTSTGRIYRISDLRTAYNKEALEALEISQLYNNSAVITDISLDTTDPDRLVASIGSYTGTNHVIYTDNATSATNDDFEGIWNAPGDLSNMPAYSVTFDVVSGNPNRVLAGTEYGIFVTDDLGNTNWVESNAGDMYRVPVYDLKQQTKTHEDNANISNEYMIYAGTFGGGLFSAGNMYVGINEVNNESNVTSLAIYPNPVSDLARVDLDLEDYSTVQLVIFDAFGKKVADLNKGKLPAGLNTLTIDAKSLASGNYILAVYVDGIRAQSGKFIVTK